MSTLKNKVQLIGNVGQEPTITTLENGKKVARLSLATNENYKNNKGEKQTHTNWHQLIAWGKIADMFELHIFKGIKLAIEGKLITRHYDDKDGMKRYITEVRVHDVLVLKSNYERIGA